jgi:hypothetical protein
MTLTVAEAKPATQDAGKAEVAGPLWRNCQRHPLTNEVQGAVRRLE